MERCLVLRCPAPALGPVPGLGPEEVPQRELWLLRQLVAHVLVRCPKSALGLVPGQVPEQAPEQNHPYALWLALALVQALFLLPQWIPLLRLHIKVPNQICQLDMTGGMCRC